MYIHNMNLAHRQGRRRGGLPGGRRRLRGAKLTNSNSNNNSNNSNNNNSSSNNSNNINNNSNSINLGGRRRRPLGLETGE